MTCPRLPDPPEASFIKVQNATYGQYKEINCASTCCQPTDQDCEIAISQIKLDDWDKIVTECNMTQSSCTVQAITSNNIGSVCPAPGISNFQVVYYICVLGESAFNLEFVTIRAILTYNKLS